MNATKPYAWKLRVAEMVRDVAATASSHYAESDAPLYLFYEPAVGCMWGCLWATSDVQHQVGTLATSQPIPSDGARKWVADVVADLPIVGSMD